MSHARVPSIMSFEDFIVFSLSQQNKEREQLLKNTGSKRNKQEETSPSDCHTQSGKSEFQ